MPDLPRPGVAPLIVAIGASGRAGLSDLMAVLGALPADLPAVVMAVLHRPSERTSHLREVLTRVSALPVLIPEQHDTLRAGACYIGKPDKHVTLGAGNRVRLVDGAGDRYRNRTIDLLFCSVAAHAGPRAVGVVLSGALHDGSRGLADIHFAGGRTMVMGQGRVASEGMPRSASLYDGPIDFIGGPDEIAGQITRLAYRPVGA